MRPATHRECSPKENAEWIALAHNHLPALIPALKPSQQERDEARRALHRICKALEVDIGPEPTPCLLAAECELRISASQRRVAELEERIRESEE